MKSMYRSVRTVMKIRAEKPKPRKARTAPGIPLVVSFTKAAIWMVMAPRINWQRATPSLNVYFVEPLSSSDSKTPYINNHGGSAKSVGPKQGKGQKDLSQRRLLYGSLYEGENGSELICACFLQYFVYKHFCGGYRYTRIPHTFNGNISVFNGS